MSRARRGTGEQDGDSFPRLRYDPAKVRARRRGNVFSVVISGFQHRQMQKMRSGATAFVSKGGAAMRQNQIS